MKFETNLQKLKESVALVEHVAGKHITLPVLSCILIEVKKNVALLRATNLDVGMEISLSVKSHDEGIVAVPAKTLSSFLSQIPDQNHVVQLELVSGNIQIVSAKTRGVIKTMPIEDFPSIPSIPDAEQFSLPSELFIKGLKSVCYSASVSSVKPELSSVYIYKDAGGLTFVATDSFRLAEKKLKISIPSQFNDILIPFKNISEIIRTLEYVKSDVEVSSNKNLISFKSGDIYIVSRVIDGVFPDYRQIIPKSFNTEAVVLKQDFLNALKVSNIFSDKFNQVHIVVDPKAKIFEIQTKNVDVGENKTLVDAALIGERVEINFNYKYIADSFQSIDSDSISLQFSGLNRPMVIKPVSGEQSFMYLAMPMNR